MRIALDAMGGDDSPRIEVEGAIQAAALSGTEIILVGDENRIKNELKKYNNSYTLPLTVMNAKEVITMNELPAMAVRKKRDSSIVVAVRLVKEGEADAVVSAGSTGAVMTACLFELGRLKGINRPAIATIMPTLTGHSVLLDVGANVDCRASNLLEFGIMGDVYTRYILKKKDPRIGLLSVGEEGSKGNELIKEAYAFFEKGPFNFIGNVEGREIVNGKADVVVCDGFIGNVVLKFGESVAEMILTLLKQEFTKGFLSKLGVMFLRPALNNFRKRIDYSEYGGAPLLGIDGDCIICHGSSSSKAIMNALRVARDFSEQKVNDHIRESLSSVTEYIGKNAIGQS
ncbi:MAG: phosphate acyltransferase PlsX [bacterium]